MNSNISFVTGDARSLSNENNSIDLIITQPPFYEPRNLNYNKKTINEIGLEKTQKKYIKSLVKATKEMERVLKPTGSIFIIISNAGSISSEYLLAVFKNTDLILANPPFVWNWSENEKVSDLGYIGFKYDLIFHFIKSPKLLYSNPYAVRKYSEAIWNVPWVNNLDNVIKKLETVGFIGWAFGTEVPKRLIEMFSKPNHTVLDPFGGSGTTACEAYLLNRNSISLDILEEQTELAKVRFEFIKDKK